MLSPEQMMKLSAQLDKAMIEYFEPMIKAEVERAVRQMRRDLMDSVAGEEIRAIIRKAVQDGLLVSFMVKPQ